MLFQTLSWYASQHRSAGIISKVWSSSIVGHSPVTKEGSIVIKWPPNPPQEDPDQGCLIETAIYSTQKSFNGDINILILYLMKLSHRFDNFPKSLEPINSRTGFWTTDLLDSKPVLNHYSGLS